jgi:hypothetical protein
MQVDSNGHIAVGPVDLSVAELEHFAGQLVVVAVVIGEIDNSNFVEI